MSEFKHGDGDDHEFVAVIGLAGRFPGAADADEFWSNLAEGLDTITREPARIIPRGGPEGQDQEYTPSRGHLDGGEWFDADYFGYSAREAVLIDPQHRVFLECSVQALEDAGQDPDRFRGRIGVYGGATETQYAQALKAQRARFPGLTDDDIALGTAPDFLVARTSERLGLNGPAVAVQSACATALVAVHLASSALLAGDCDMAIAGGVAVHVPPKKMEWTQADGTLAPDGVCRAFDARGAGTVASNGVGVVVLKRLDQAVADGDHIRAVVRGSAVTNDGAARIGFTAPSVEGQAAAIREAQEAAGTDARSITYVEAHGTATPLGDPIELAALTRAFRRDTDDKGFCAIGSVKTNIGHTDAAAGAAGFIKTVLALQHKVIPPSLHHTEPNPRIDFAASPFRVATELREWEPYDGVRRAGVSSFAVGGVNAHLVLEEAPERVASPARRSAQLFVHSAATKSALRARVRAFTQYLDDHSDLSPADVAWTLQTGRTEHEHRAFTVHGEGLPASSEPTVADGPPRERPVSFLFPGEVAPPETWRLHSCEPEFEAAFDRCLEAVPAELAGLVRRVARGTAAPSDPVARDLYVFALEYALAALWQRWGVRPALVLGTGVGALTAAVVAGAFAPQDAVRLLTARSGARPDGDGHGEPLEAIRSEPLRVPLVLTHTGVWHDSGTLIEAQEWERELTGPAALDEALATLLSVDRVLLQVGAGTTLHSRVSGHAAHTPEHLVVTTLQSRGPMAQNTLASLYTALGRLWLAGTPVAWHAVHDGERRHKVPLPTYPFERLPFLVRHPDHEAQTTGRSVGAAPMRPVAAEEERADTSPVAAGGPSTTDGARPPSSGPEADDTPLGVVLKLFSEALGFPDLDPDESFFELGGDSLTATKVLAEIREIYPVEVNVRTLFTASTAAELAALLDQLLADQQSHTTNEEPT